MSYPSSATVAIWAPSDENDKSLIHVPLSPQAKMRRGKGWRWLIKGGNLKKEN